MPQRPVQISIYSNRAPVGAHPVRRAGLSWQTMRVVRGTIVAAVCVLAHGLLFTAAMWSARSPAPTSRDMPARVSLANSEESDDLQWVAIDPHSITDESKPKLQLPKLAHLDVQKVLQDAALLIPDVDLPSTPDATVADAGRLSKMYGRYMGQITARIDRAWLRPRTPIDADSFACQVLIHQDAIGTVLDIQLEQCNGDTRWQLSLVQAIQSASPLPAPPDPDVFSRTLHLAFKAEAYRPQSPVDEYEPQAAAHSVEAAWDAQRANAALEHMSDSRASGIIRLNILGDHQSVELQNNTVPDGSHAVSRQQ